MIGATLVYIRRHGQTLMLYRNKKQNDYHEGKYNGIGGKIEKAETPYQCAVREIKEETELQAQSLVYRGHVSFPVFDGTDDWMCFIYECFDFIGEVGICSEGELQWIDDDKITSLNLWAGDKYFIDVIYQTDQHFYGAFFYNNKTLVSYDLTTY